VRKHNLAGLGDLHRCDSDDLVAETAWATSAVPLSATLGRQDPANGHLFAALAAGSVAMRR
jgi:hypothetical protein